MLLPWGWEQVTKECMSSNTIDMKYPVCEHHYVEVRFKNGMFKLCFKCEKIIKSKSRTAQRLSARKLRRLYNPERQVL